MKRHLFNAVFYITCFFLLSGSVYRLGFTVPPLKGDPSYSAYFWGVIVMSASMGLLVVLPNLVIEYWSSQS